MRGTVLCVLVCGCNPVFGIDSTELVDAPPPPPPIDAPAPFTCPPIGTLPAFGVDLTMVSPARGCNGLVTDATGENIAAMCLDTSTQLMKVFVGPATSGFGKIAMDIAPSSPYAVRMAPEGDRLFVHDTVTLPNYEYEYRVVEYTLDGGMWMQGKVFRPPGTLTSDYFTLGQPSRGPTRRMVWPRYNQVSGKYDLVEFQWDGQTATELHVTDLGDVATAGVDHVSLTGDGLRLVMTAFNYYGGGQQLDPGTGVGISNGDAPVYYMDRASLDEAFKGPPVLLESVPNRVTGPVMTEDCGRVYFGALDTYWYLEQPR